jgi:DNA-binding protein HU-beta
MKKADLIRALAQKTGLTGVAVESVLESLAVEVAAELRDTGKSSVPGICRLAIEERAPRRYRNPKTGEPVQSPARRKVKVEAAGTLSTAALGE